MVDCTFYIEAQSNNRIAVETSLRELLKEAEHNVDVVESHFEEISENEYDGGTYYSGILRLRVKTDFRKYINLCMRLTPTAIDFHEGELTVEKEDLLLVFGDVSSHITKLSKKLDLAIQQTGGKIQEKPGIDEDVIDEMLNYGGILMKMVFEGHADSEEILKEKFMEVANASGAYVNKMNSQQIEGPEWTGVVGMELLFEDIEDVFLTVVKLIPVAMGIVEPETVTISMRELQNIGMDLSEVVQSFISTSISSRL